MPCDLEVAVVTPDMSLTSQNFILFVGYHLHTEERVISDVAEPDRMKNNEPVAVAGRGRLAAKLANPISLGRGERNIMFPYLYLVSFRLKTTF